MLNFRQIEIFRAVMIAKTVSGAAQMLNASQPGLSRMLKHMEDRLGFPLFDRTGGRLAPTQEARVLFDEIQFLYKGIEDLDHIARRLAKGQDRVFRIGASPSLGHSVLPRMLRRLTALHPTVIIQFDVLSVEQVVDYLALQRGEYALTVFPTEHPNIRSQRLGSGRMVCVLPRDHPAAAGHGRVPLAALFSERIVSFRRDTPHGRIIDAMFAAAGCELVVSSFVRFAETALAFVENGMGIAFVDEFTASQSHSDAIRVVELEEEGTVPVYLNRSSLAPRSVISDTFETMAREVLGRMSERS